MRLFSFVTAMTLLLAGCSSDPEPTPEPEPAPATASTEPAPAAPTDPVTAEAQDHSRRGVQLLNDKAYDEAAQSFTRVLQLTPDDPYAYAGRAVAFDELNRDEEAVADATKAIAIAERSGADAVFVLDLHELRGTVLTDLGRFEEGEADLTRCIENGRDDSELRLRRSICLLELEQLDRALADAEVVVANAPNDEVKGRGLQLRGFVHERQGSVDKAVADFEAAIAVGNTGAEEDLERVRAAAPR